MFTQADVSFLAWRIAHWCVDEGGQPEDGSFCYCGLTKLQHAAWAWRIHRHLLDHRAFLRTLAEMLKTCSTRDGLEVADTETMGLWATALEYHLTELATAKDYSGGWVYFIRCGEFIKIGLSGNVEKRIAALQAANPYTLTLLHKIPVPDMPQAEARLHAYFNSHRLKGEWFRLSDAEIEEVLAFTSRDILWLERRSANDEQGALESRLPLVSNSNESLLLSSESVS